MPWLLRMTLLAAVLVAILNIYLGWRIGSVLRSFVERRRWRRGLQYLPLLFLLFYILPVTGYLEYAWSGSVDIYSYPKPLFYLFWFGLAFSFQLVTWVLLADLGLLVTWVAGIDRQQAIRYHNYFVISVTVLLLIYSGVHLYRDSNRIVTDQMQWSVDGLPAALDGMRIVHISDIQADRFTGRDQVRKYIDKINRLNPDLVVFTGDLISYGTDYIPMAARELARVDAEWGTYAVIGDHDYWAGSDHVINALTEREISVLANRNQPIRVKGHDIRLTGITHVYSKQVDPQTVEKLVQDSTQSSLRILASHQINDMIIDNARQAGYRLVLSGHTHGGQVRVPLLFQKYSASGFETDYVRGTYRRDSLLINVNSGLGFTLAPVRYNAPASISLIELQRK